MVAAWRGDALKRIDDGVRMGDPDALMSAVFGYSFLGKEATPEEAYMLFLATNKVLGAIRRDQRPYAEPTLGNSARSLSPQQKTEAEQQAEEIFRTWKRRAA
jgi:hypothetical protein